MSLRPKTPSFLVKRLPTNPSVVFDNGNCPPASPRDFPDPLDSWRTELKWSDGSMEFLSQPCCLGDHFFGQVAELEKLLHVEGTDNHSSWIPTDQGGNLYSTDSTLPSFGCEESRVIDSSEGTEDFSSHPCTDQSLSLTDSSLAGNGGEEQDLCFLKGFCCLHKTDLELSDNKMEAASTSPSPDNASNDTKVLEKRKRNNEASRKFRRKRKSTHQSLFAKAQKLESDNHILKLQVQELLKEVGSLKASLGQTLILCQ